MLNLPFRSLLLSTAVLLALCLEAASAQAQNPAAQPSAAASAAPAKPNPPIPATKENDELLAKAARLYYSSASAGMDGFDCAVHPDWRAVFAGANQSPAVTEDDPRVVLLKPVVITLHARMKGGSTLEWIEAPNPDKPLNEDSTAMLDSMHQATEKTLQGFLQFWTPFFDGSVVPASSEGLRIETSAKGYTLHVEDKGTKVTEFFDSGLILEEFDVATSEAVLNFNPFYKATDKGMLVSNLIAHIQTAGKTPKQTEEMHVQVEYQTVDDFPIPARLNLEVVGTGIFNFDFDDCKVVPGSK